MIYTLPYESDEQLKSNYFKIRDIANTKLDVIHVTVQDTYLNELSTEAIYKRVLKLDGKYRSQRNKWNLPAIRVRVIRHL